VFQPDVEKCQKAEECFPSITPHDLRHSAASLAVSAGANMKAVERMLGHAKAFICGANRKNLEPCAPVK
jgi:site-specific recombinase XerD